MPASKQKTNKNNRIITIFQRLQAHNPDPKTELEYKTHFQLLIAVMLSAQATDKSVNLATPALFAAAPTPEAIYALGIKGLEKYIKSIGLYPTKAKHIIATCQILIEQFNSQVPEDRDALQTLPGVGRKTANVVLNAAFGHPTMPVDTHVSRVSQRLELSKQTTPEKIEQDLLKIIPEPYRQNAHHWLVLHGRYVCTARSPKCLTCILNDLCPYWKK